MSGRTAGATSGSARLDPDELALMEEERDHLLASIEDLEREYAAGDMDEVDYLELKDDYTVRTAEVLRAIDERRALHRDAAPPQRRRNRVLVATGVLVFAGLAGVLVAQGSGQRGGGPISGGISNLRSELARCQQASFQDPAGGVECYDDLLADAPDNVEALTYQGWALIRSERVREGAANFERVVELDPDYPDVRAFRAIVAARAGDHEAAAAEVDRFYRNDPAPAAVQILQSQGLEREIFVRLLDEGTRGCWVDAAEGTAGGSAGDDGADPAVAASAEQFIAGLATCLDDLLAAEPGSSDALVSRAYALLARGDGDLARGAELARRAVAADPEDPNAVLMHASVAVAEGRYAEARADLARLDQMPRPTISFLIGAPATVREALDSATAPSTTTTTTAPSGTGAGGPPSIPNPDGG